MGSKLKNDKDLTAITKIVHANVYHMKQYSRHTNALQKKTFIGEDGLNESQFSASHQLGLEIRPLN